MEGTKRVLKLRLGTVKQEKTSQKTLRSNLEGEGCQFSKTIHVKETKKKPHRQFRRIWHVKITFTEKYSLQDKGIYLFQLLA